MGIWVLNIISDLLIPVIMIFLGRYFDKNPPKDINGMFGYRTSMSKKNKDTWEFANHYCGRLWTIIGWIMLIISIISILFLIGKSVGTVAIFGGIICMIQVVFLVGSIFPIEQALKRNFDKDGNRKSNLK